MQVMYVFVAAKISAIFAQQYLPFYFLDTLKMNQVYYYYYTASDV